MTPADFRFALERIAQSVAMLPGAYPTLYLGMDREAVSAIVGIGGRLSVSIHEADESHPLRAIDGAAVTVGGMEFRALASRPLTDTERAAFDGDVAVTP